VQERGFVLSALEHFEDRGHDFHLYRRPCPSERECPFPSCAVPHPGQGRDLKITETQAQVFWGNDVEPREKKKVFFFLFFCCFLNDDI